MIFQVANWVQRRVFASRETGRWGRVVGGVQLMDEGPGGDRLRKGAGGLQERGGELPSPRQVMSGTGGERAFKRIFLLRWNFCSAELTTVRWSVQWHLVHWQWCAASVCESWNEMGSRISRGFEMESGTLKEAGFVQVLTGGTRSYWPGPNCKCPKDATWTPASRYRERFRFAMALAATYIQLRLLFCQHPSEFFGNNTNSLSLLSLKTVDFYSYSGEWGVQFGLLQNLSSQGTPKRCFCFILTTNLNSLSVGLLVLDISYEQSPAVCDLLGWASCSCVFQVIQVVTCMSTSFSQLNKIPLCGHVTVTYPFAIDGHLDFFQLLAFVIVQLWICAPKYFVWVPVVSSFEWIAKA